MNVRTSEAMSEQKDVSVNGAYGDLEQEEKVVVSIENPVALSQAVNDR
jgi:hypothetical protein